MEKIVVIIPVRLASSRFPRKALYHFYDVPMIEHVRRRAAKAEGVDEVYVATCDDEVKDVIEGFGGKVLLTSSSHETGTDRVEEASRSVDCTHVISLQGDEPLILPEQIELFVENIKRCPEVGIWNAIAPIESESELMDESIVKCTLDKDGRVSYMFRRSPWISLAANQMEFTKKVLGVLAFSKSALRDLNGLELTPIARSESIEQLKVIEHGGTIFNISYERGFPGVNLTSDVDLVHQAIKDSPRQQALLGILS